MLNIDRSQNQSYIINSYFKRRKTLLWRVYLTFKQTRIYFVPTFYKVHHFLFGTLKYNLKSLQLLWTCVQGSLIAINNFLHFGYVLIVYFLLVWYIPGNVKELLVLFLKEVIGRYQDLVDHCSRSTLQKKNTMVLK